jgi:parallel beta-helix repeat protein
MRNKRTFILFGFAVIAAGMAQAGTPITTCGYVITAPGDYTVMNNPTSCSTNFGIDIEASHVVVQVNGHIISSVPSNGGSHGILVNANGGTNTLTGIQIIGPGLIEGWQEGIDTFNPISNILIQGLTLASNTDRGMNLRTSSQVTFAQNVVARNSGAGVYVDGGSTQVNIISNEFTANGQTGLYLHGNSNGNQISLNVVAGNAADGIVVDGSSKNTVQLNTTVANGGSGMHVLSGATANAIHDNLSTANGTTSGYDLEDDNACGSNTWNQDVFFTSNQSCIK